MTSRAVYLVFFLLLGAAVLVSGEGLRPLWLPSVRTLVFRAGENAVGRRGVYPQLECVGAGGANDPKYHPSLIECRNVRAEGADVVWRCKGQTHRDVELDATTVICEGFEGPDDPYVTPGSCTLEYTLRYAKNAEGYGGLYYLAIALVLGLLTHTMARGPNQSPEDGSPRSGRRVRFDDLWDTSGVPVRRRRKKKLRSSTGVFGDEIPSTKAAGREQMLVISEALEHAHTLPTQLYGDDDILEQADEHEEPSDLFHGTDEGSLHDNDAPSSEGFEFVRSLLEGITSAAQPVNSPPAAEEPSEVPSRSSRRRRGSVSLSASTASTERREEPGPEATTSTSTAGTQRREEPAVVKNTSSAAGTTRRRAEEEEVPLAKTKRREEVSLTHETVTTETRTTRRTEHTPASTSTSTARTKRR